MSSSRDIATFAGVVGGLTGELKMWPNPTAPAGYLLCDGSLVSRTTYAALFATIGTNFGAGNGSTTFALPDYRDRMPIGAGHLYSSANTGGNKDSIVPSHSHGVTDSGHNHGLTDPGHSHTVGAQNTDTGSTFTNGINRVTTTLTNTGTSSTGISISPTTSGVSINSAGVSATNANLPPYLGIHFIIRYL
jgi:microcystin-dependent protein